VKLFVGLEIPRRVREAVADRCANLRQALPQASWVSSDNYHLLLAFLGEVDEDSLPAIGEALRSVFASRSSFELQLAHTGSTPPMRPARTLWVGVKDWEALEKLQEAVWSSLTPVVDIEAFWRPFHAHLTVARCSKPWGRRCVEIWSQSCPGTVGEAFQVRQGALFRSRPEATGVSYEVIESYPMLEAS
jgi:2'-5' RNA ligase